MHRRVVLLSAFFAALTATVSGRVLAAGGISRDEAVSLALDYASVAKRDIINLKIDRDEEHGVPVYSIEFETKFGDFDLCVARSSGRIIDADMEIDDEWVRRQPSAANPESKVRREVLRRVPGASSADIRLRQEGRRWEGVLRHDGMKYEFEADRRTGLIFDWTAERRV